MPSGLADLIRNTAFIIWNEVLMQHHYCFETLGQTLRDICSSDDGVLFGGISVVLGVGFAQIPPIVKQGSCPEIVAVSLMPSRFWLRLQKPRLTKNMGLANSNDTDMQFADWMERMSYESSMIGCFALLSF